jgi:hypothetical protein
MRCVLIVLCLLVRAFAANPWNYIRRLTDPEDYVIVKLKAGSISAETEFMKQVLEWQGADIRSNIDEIFFEHKVNLQVQSHHTILSDLAVTAMWQHKVTDASESVCR